jgi:hypothetical protein
VTFEELAARVLSSRVQILRYGFILQALAGAVLLFVANIQGHDHFHLIQDGVRAPGTVVDFKEHNFRSDDGAGSDTALMPIVEFQAGGRIVRFQDWKGSDSGASLRAPVTVLYDPARPSDAMIDRPVWNWLPWAPIGAVGLFLALVAIKGGVGLLLSRLFHNSP